MSTRSATGGHARPRKSLLPRWNRRAAAPFGSAPPSPPIPASAADDTLLFRVPGLDGGPGLVIPPWGEPAGLPSQGPDLGELTLADKPLGVLRPETAPERAEPGPDLADAPQDRPYVPQDSGLPSAWLRAIPQSGPGSRVLETLTGLPFYAGARHGTGVQGICLGAADDIWLILDTESAEVLDALEAAVRQARDSRVYGGFRTQAVPADPEAAEHREALERELDACAEWARGVLRAAGNLGFLSAALKQRDGEGALNVFVARADLARAVEAGDEAPAAEAANKLVAIVRDLCGKAAADSLARGEVLAAEAEAAPEVPAEAVTAAGEGEAA
jgi:hypothetical protein